MVVAVNSTCKVPYACFLINGLSGIDHANLIKVCLRKLLEVGVKVISLPCDGPSCRAGASAQRLFRNFDYNGEH